MLQRIANVPWQAIKIIILVVMVVGLGYLGACVYQNFFADREVKPPSFDKAPYEVTIQGTGKRLFTSDFEQNSDIYILHGYWELKGNKFVWHDQDIKLDEAIFGNIIIKVRGLR